MPPAIIRLRLSFIHHTKGPQPTIVTSQEVLVPSLGHPHLPCFPCSYGVCGSSPLHPLAPFLALLKLLCCHTLPCIDAHCILLCNPGRCPPHDASVDVKVDQRTPDFVWHVLHRFKEMSMWLMIAADNNAESNGIDDWSSIDAVQVVVVLQLGGCGGWRGGNDAARLIFLACGCCCRQQQMMMTATVTVTMGIMTTSTAAGGSGSKKGKDGDTQTTINSNWQQKKRWQWR